MSFDYKRLIKFELNISDQEKKYRVMGGAALILVSIFTAKIILLVVGMALVATGYSGWCPAYSSLDKNTLNSGQKPTA
ncbi:MAG: DUF2892 domain-containing protein [Methylococcales bacterium]